MSVAPSILSLDYTKFNEQMEQVNVSGAEYIHFDVMDGNFVPNISFGPDILKAFKKVSDLTMDVHLMITKPLFFSDIFAKAGADIITFHYEAVDTEEEIHALANHIHELGCKAGISIKPGTSLDVLKPFLNDFDLFLIMSVEPGFGGQKFIPECLERIRTLKQWLLEVGSEALIEVDGGINGETGKLCIEAGVDILVAGSYVFNNNIQEAVNSLV